MLNATKEFQNRMNAGTPIVCHADVVFANGESLKLTHSDFMSTGNSVNDCADNKSLPVGTAVAKSATITLSNHQRKFDNYDFFGAKITLYAVMQLDNTVERLRKGVFYVITPVSPGETIQLTMIDDMHKFDKTYKTKISFPATIGSVVRDSCSTCGVQLDSITFSNDGFIVEEMPENITHRQVIAAAAMISGGNARIDVNGRLKIVEYSERVFNTLDGGVFDEDTPYSSGDSFDGGNFSDYNSGDSFDGGVFGDRDDIHVVYRFKNAPVVSTDDITITGIMLKTDDVEYQYGKDDYVLAFENPLTKGHESEFCEYLANKLVGLTVRPMSGDIMTNPLMEFGDPMLFVDRRGNSYMTIITDVSYNFLGYTTIKCQAEDKISNKSQIPSWSEQTYQKLKNELSRDKTEWEKAMENLSDRLENSGGLYTTIEKQEDGSSVFYMHDKPLVADSLILWKMTRDAWGVSTDGGKTWNGGMTVDGEMITKILNTIGLNADWINTGAFVVKDAHGNVMFLADTATGRVVIVADEFMLRGKTIEELSQEANEVILDALAQDIQTQLDGKIETYNQTSDPSTAWTTTAAKQAHTGDLWYSSSTKLTKRWNGTAWSPLTMEDTAAQELAKSKKRVFISTPVPPYDVGDLWVGNSASDMKRCQTARSSGSYVSSDWIKAVKYTDDSTALSAYYLAEDAMNASKAPINYLTQKAIFDKLTNNGVTQGIYMGTDSKIYINAAYLRSGIIEGIEGRFTTGIVGGFTIGPAKMYGTSSNGKVVAMQKSSVDTGTAFAAGGVNHSNYSDCPFRVRMDGALFSTKGTFNNAIIKNGTIEIPVTSGYADLTIDSSGMRFNGIMVVGEEGGAPGYQTSPIIIKSNIASGGYTDGDIIVSKGGMWKEVASRCRMYGSQMYATKFNTTSDVRYKKEVTDIEEKYELLFNALRPVRYKWKRGDDSDFHMGFIAQEVLAAIEGAGLSKEEFGGYNEDKKIDSEMTEDQDGNQVEAYVESEEVELSLNYIEFIPINTHMIQKNRAEIKKLKLENAVLKQELAGIKTKLDKLVEMIGGEG